MNSSLKNVGDSLEAVRQLILLTQWLKETEEPHLIAQTLKQVPFVQVSKAFTNGCVEDLRREYVELLTDLITDPTTAHQRLEETYARLIELQQDLDAIDVHLT